MFDGLNLGLAINIADGASVNANKISTSIQKLLGLSNQLKNDSKKTGTGVDGLANSLGNAGKRGTTASGGVRQFANSLDSATPHLINFRSAVIRLFPYVSVLGGIYAVKRGIDSIILTTKEYEYAMKNLEAATGYSRQEMNLLDSQFRKMAVGSRFSAKEIAEAGYDLTTTIPIAAQDVEKLTTSVLNYATATQYSVQESGLDMLGLLAKTGRPLSDANMLFDQMARTVNVSSLTAQRLSEMLKLVGTEAVTMNVPFNELLALMGQTDLYYKGGEGGTRLRMMFQALAQDTKRHTDILARYGLSMKDVDIKSQGLYTVLAKLRGIGYGDLTRIVGGYSAGLIIRLSEDAQKMKTLSQSLTGEIASGTVALMKDVQFNTLDGRMKQLKNIKDELKLTLGGILNKSFIGVMAKAGDELNYITGKIKQNSGPLVMIAAYISTVIKKSIESVSGLIQKVLGWMGVMADTTTESQSKMRNNLIPFLVFVEVMRLRVVGFIEGFAAGFRTGVKDIVDLISTIIRPFGFFVEIMPKGTTAAYSLGAALGYILPLMFMFQIAVKAIAWGQALFNSVAMKNPYIALGIALFAVVAAMRWISNNKEDVIKWLDESYPKLKKFRESLGFMTDEEEAAKKQKVRENWVKIGNAIIGVFKWVAQQIEKVIDGIVNAIPEPIKKLLGMDLIPKTEKWSDKIEFIRPDNIPALQWDAKEGKSKASYGSGTAVTSESLMKAVKQQQAKFLSTLPGVQPVELVKKQKFLPAAIAQEKPKEQKSTPSVQMPKVNVSVKGFGPTDAKYIPKGFKPGFDGASLDKSFGRAVGLSDDQASAIMDASETGDYDAVDDIVDRDIESAKTVVSTPDTSSAMQEYLRSAQTRVETAESVSRAAATYEFHFGNIMISMDHDDPELIAREIVPYIKKVLRQEVGR
ncbi:MAG: phage tail tape measure protein [bacterium]